MPFKPQSLSSPSRHVDKSLMFEGLDDLDSGNAATFKPRKNFKKLVIPSHSPRPVSVCVCLSVFLCSSVCVCVCVCVRACVCCIQFLHVCSPYHDRHKVFQTLLLLLPLQKPHAAR